MVGHMRHIRRSGSWRFSLSASPIPENPLPAPSAGVRMTPVPFGSNQLVPLSQTRRAANLKRHLERPGYHVTLEQGRRPGDLIDTIPIGIFTVGWGKEPPRYRQLNWLWSR